MPNEFQMYIRGQIWHVERGEVEIYGSVQDKSRPFLIVSNDDGNGSNDVLMMVPITSQPKSKIPSNVEFRMNNRNSTIICNQVMTISKQQLGNYMGSVSIVVMRDVDRAITYSLDLRTGRTTLKDIEYLIDDLFVKHQKQLEQERCTLSTDQVIGFIKDRLQQLNNVSKEDATPGGIVDLPPQEDFAYHKKHANELKKENSKVHSESNSLNDVKTDQMKRRVWTDELMMEFLIDCDSKMPIEEMMDKWKVSRTTIPSNKSLFKKKLNLK